MNDETHLGPYLSQLPAELVLEVALTLSSSSQADYATLLLVSRTLRDLCRLTCLRVVPIVLHTPSRTSQFADYLATDDRLAPRVRRLWIIKDQYNILTKCTNLTTLACDGHDLIPIVSSDEFRHTQLSDLTIMGLWDFWASFAGARYGRMLCGQLRRLWLLDHLFLHGINKEWLVSLEELAYWSIEVREGRGQFKSELGLLEALPTLEKLLVLIRSPSWSVFLQLKRINEPRLEVLSWGKRSEVMEWICQRG